MNYCLYYKTPIKQKGRFKSDLSVYIYPGFEKFCHLVPMPFTLPNPLTFFWTEAGLP